MAWQLHTNWIHGSYNQDRNLSIKVAENDPLRLGQLPAIVVDFDGNNNAVIGYGYDLFENSVATLSADLATASAASSTTVVLSAADQALLSGYQAGSKTLAEVLVGLTLTFPDECQRGRVLQCHI